MNGLFEQYFSLFAVVEQRAQITTQAHERFEQRDSITTQWGAKRMFVKIAPRINKCYSGDGCRHIEDVT